MSSCSTPWCAEYVSWQIAARIPWSLQAATEAPTPEPQTRIPRSASPVTIASPSFLGHVRIVDPRLGRVDAEIDRVVAQGLELREDGVAQLHAAVVEGDGDPHQPNGYVTAVNDVELWRELGQQFRVDSIRTAAAREVRAPELVHVRRRPDGRARRQVPALRLRPAGRPAQRPARLLQGARVAAAVLDLPRRRRDHRRASCSPTGSTGAARGAPDAGDPVGRRGDRLARPGPADRRRHGARRPSASTAGRPGLGAARRQRDWPRARSGRRSSTPRTTSSTT